MAISRFSTSRVGAGLPKYQKLWDGTTVIAPPNSFESIATITGVTGTVSFTSIPQTYKHLQLVIMAVSAGGVSDIVMRYNNDSTSSYVAGQTRSGRATPQSYQYTNNSYALATTNTGQSSLAPNVAFVDILDYTATNKYKNSRSQNGYDYNTGGESVFCPSVWLSTSAINRIDIFNYPSGSFNSNSVFALYGIKG